MTAYHESSGMKARTWNYYSITRPSQTPVLNYCIVCIETADNGLLPSVPVARIYRREAKMHGGRPHCVFEVVPNVITRYVAPDPNPDDDMLLDLSPNHDHSNGATDR